jgi:hypothetical protein
LTIKEFRHEPSSKKKKGEKEGYFSKVVRQSRYQVPLENLRSLWHRTFVKAEGHQEREVFENQILCVLKLLHLD